MSPALSHLIAAAEGGHPIVNELPFPPIVFGIIALALFMVALMALWFFRNTLALDPHGTSQGTDPDTRSH